MPVLPLNTPRLALRLMNEADVEVFAGYRAIDGIARFQDWPMPYTVDLARSSLSKQSTRGDVTKGEWVSIAIEFEGAVVGDVAVGLSDGGEIATLGYTLAPAHHGRGFAGEAVAAVTDALFEHTSVHRIAATLDARNGPSMRVLESVGFRYEGLLRQSVLVRGDWVDDMFFGLVRDERTAWRSRNLAPPETVKFVQLDATNNLAYRRLETHQFQQRFVSSVTKSLADALLPDVVDGAPVQPWFRGIEADGVPVGFLMIAEVTDVHAAPHLWRLLVDRVHQRRGIGGSALSMLIGQLREAGNVRLSVSYVDDTGGPRRFYERFGFVATGEIREGEVVATLDLD